MGVAMSSNQPVGGRLARIQTQLDELCDTVLRSVDAVQYIAGQLVTFKRTVLVEDTQRIRDLQERVNWHSSCFDLLKRSGVLEDTGPVARLDLAPLQNNDGDAVQQLRKLGFSVGDSCYWAALGLKARGEHGAALDCCEKALQVWLGSDVDASDATLLAGAVEAKGAWIEALQRSETDPAMRGKEHELTSNLMQPLSDLLRPCADGKERRAERLSKVAGMHRQIAELLMRQGNAEVALQQHLCALEAYAACRGGDGQLEAAECHLGAAAALSVLSRPDEELKQREKALAIQRVCLGTLHPKVGENHYAMGTLHHEHGGTSSAEEAWKQYKACVDVYASHYGTEHERTADAQAKATDMMQLVLSRALSPTRSKSLGRVLSSGMPSSESIGKGKHAPSRLDFGLPVAPKEDAQTTVSL
eukprot:NODE_831_length_1349_cov_259.108964.p1 GENE.NODE_831_length_1349_cov_259.108964~~NODE_831_length_1349_cov_259.108964.p1  ORF type:complete len:416 (+),score=99.03 NODE_831_length_1349_cov_259.108964:3-1250(+)